MAVPFPILTGKVFIVSLKNIAFITEIFNHSAMSESFTCGGVAGVAPVLWLIWRLAYCPRKERNTRQIHQLQRCMLFHAIVERCYTNKLALPITMYFTASTIKISLLQYLTFSWCFCNKTDLSLSMDICNCPWKGKKKIKKKKNQIQCCMLFHEGISMSQWICL